jgi:protein-disulfide isomerase
MTGSIYGETRPTTAVVPRQRGPGALLWCLALLVLATAGFGVVLHWRRANVRVAQARPPEVNPIGAFVTPVPEPRATPGSAWVAPIASGAPNRFDQHAALPIAPGDHTLGSHAAPVTIMLFGDLTCPFTLRTFRVLRQLLDERPGTLRMVWRHRPMRPERGNCGA